MNAPLLILRILYICWADRILTPTVRHDTNCQYVSVLFIHWKILSFRLVLNDPTYSYRKIYWCHFNRIYSIQTAHPILFFSRCNRLSFVFLICMNHWITFWYIFKFKSISLLSNLLRLFKIFFILMSINVQLLLFSLCYIGL